MALEEALDAVGDLALELRRTQHAGVLAETQDPCGELPAIRVARLEDDVPRVLGTGRADLAEAPEVALDLPRDPLGDLDLGRLVGLAELPDGAVGVRARIEARRAALEVVLGLRRVRDLALDAREPEHAQRVALVRMAQEIELAALVEQVVRVDLARACRVARHRVVVERDRLVAEDRGLDLRQPLGEVVPAGRRRDAERDPTLLGRAQRVRAPPGDLLQGEAQRLGVRELAVKQRQRRLQRRELGVRERDRRKVEVLGPQRVVLLLGDAVDGPFDGQHDAERVELGAVRVEAPRERVLVHRAVALDVAPDLQRGHRPPLRHEVGDQGELADELLRVLGHGRHDTGRRRSSRRHASLFAEFCAWSCARLSESGTDRRTRRRSTRPRRPSDGSGTRRRSSCCSAARGG